MKCPPNFNCDRKIVGEMGPRVTSSLITHQVWWYAMNIGIIHNSHGKHSIRLLPTIKYRCNYWTLHYEINLWRLMVYYNTNPSNAQNHHVALKCARHIESSPMEVPVKFQGDRAILNTNCFDTLWDLITNKTSYGVLKQGLFCGLI